MGYVDERDQAHSERAYYEKKKGYCVICGKEVSVEDAWCKRCKEEDRKDV